MCPPFSKRANLFSVPPISAPFEPFEDSGAPRRIAKTLSLHSPTLFVLMIVGKPERRKQEIDRPAHMFVLHQTNP